MKLRLVAVILAMVCSLPAYAEYTYQLLTAPGGLATYAFGINNGGKVVGWAYDETWSAFSYEYDMKKGGYTILGYDFLAMEISNTGFMVGNPGYAYWMCAVRDKQGNVTPLYPPSWNDAVSLCDARGVNPDGKVSGFVTDEDGVWWGFIYDPEYDTFEEFLPSSRTIGSAINAQGQQAGSRGSYGYVREPDGSVKLECSRLTVWPTFQKKGAAGAERQTHPIRSPAPAGLFFAAGSRNANPARKGSGK